MVDYLVLDVGYHEDELLLGNVGFDVLHEGFRAYSLQSLEYKGGFLSYLLLLGEGTGGRDVDEELGVGVKEGELEEVGMVAVQDGEFSRTFLHHRGLHAFLHLHNVLVELLEFEFHVVSMRLFLQECQHRLLGPLHCSIVNPYCIECKSTIQ